MTALASPYRFADTPLLTRERALEQELAGARARLDAFSNEEVRLERRVLLGESPRGELAAVTANIEQLVATVDRVASELESVRAELVARGERKHVGARTGDDDNPDRRWAVATMLLAIVIAVLIAGLTHLHRIDTAHDAPPGTSMGWGGPLEPGQTWLYVEGPPGGKFEVDGRPFLGPNRVPVSALHGHDVQLAGGGRVLVRWIPCTTAVVSHSSDLGEPAVERFYNSSTCF